MIIIFNIEQRRTDVEVPSFEKSRASPQENKGELTDERFLYPDASTACLTHPQ